MTSETEIRAALVELKKANGQRELNEARFELAHVCSADNITALLAEIDALRVDAERYRWIRKKVYVIGLNGDNGCQWTAPTSDDETNAIDFEQNLDAAIAQSKGCA